MKKYKYSRLYDYCATKEDYKSYSVSSRAMNCKYRIHTAIGVSLISITIIIIAIYETNNWMSVSFLISLGWFWFLYVTRMGVFTLIQIIRLYRILKLEKKTLLQKVIVHINEYGKHLNLNSKYHNKTKSYAFNWLKTKISFQDDQMNMYHYIITHKKVKFRIDLYKDNPSLGSDFKYGNYIDVRGIETIKEFQNRIREHFLTCSETIKKAHR